MSDTNDIAREMDEQRAIFHQKALKFTALAHRARVLGDEKLAEHYELLAKTFADT